VQTTRRPNRAERHPLSMINATKYDKTDALSRSGAASFSPSLFALLTNEVEYGTPLFSYE
jgi:hypothetical protein|tara:strand:- start:1429 stop:1608 length:180 start_codon:yes stop_codon:yes gene_type:complete